MLALISVILLLVRPYITAIISAGILAFLVYPLYKRIYSWTQRPHLSAILITLLMVIAIILPVALITEKIADESKTVYSIAKQEFFEGDAEEKELYCAEGEGLVCLLYKGVGELRTNKQLKDLTEDTFQKLSGSLLQAGSDFILAIPSVVLNIFIVLFIAYYLLLDGQRYMKNGAQYLPMSEDKREYLVQSFQNTARGVIFGLLMVALVQGAVATVGYFFVGFSSALFLGLVTAFFSLIPLIGTGAVWFPASAFLFITGLVSGEPVSVWKGIGLFVYGALVISTVDNILRPKLVGDAAGVHPVTALLGILGGIHLFGFLGIIIGPLLLSFSLLMLRLYMRDMNEAES